MVAKVSKSTRFNPTNPDHLAVYAVSYEGFEIHLEYCDGLDALRIVILTPEGEELTRPRFWNKHCPSEAVDMTFQDELLPMIEYRRAHPERFNWTTSRPLAA